MKSVCLYFSVHLPFLLKSYLPENIAVDHTYEDVVANREALDFAADHCYLPANEILYRHLQQEDLQFAVNFSISGTLLQQLQEYRPDVLVSFQRLVNTGKVEILAETYYHSLSFLYSGHEFRRQVEKHSLLVADLFGKRPKVFRNTELIYSNDLARVIYGLGYKGILCEGTERHLHGRSPNHVYTSPGNEQTSLLLRNRSLSDDIAFRYNDTVWPEHPLTAAKFAAWLHALPAEEEVVNLFMDYGTFGIHKTADTGIFQFLDELPVAVKESDYFCFSTPTAVLGHYQPRDLFDVPQPVSWESQQDCSSLYCVNSMQHNTRKKIYDIEQMVMSCGNSRLIETWGMLQAADHFYSMKEEEQDPEQNAYYNPFKHAASAGRNYSNIVVDFEISVIKENIGHARHRPGNYLPVNNLY
jgi:alpha-amylase